MANSKRKKSGKPGPKEDQIGHKRPSRFEEDEGFKHSWKKLPPSEKGQLVAQLKRFKADWCNPEITAKDLNTVWEYKALQGASKKSGAMQIRLSNHRVALVVITEEDPCVWLLEIFKKAGKKNPTDIDRAAERARRIREGLG